MADIRLLFVTIPPPAADDFVQTLCRERLIACGNIVSGVRSHYWWEDRLCSDDESIVFMETAADRVDQAMARITEIHPYDCPKIVVLDPDRVNDPYTAWVLAETRTA